MRQIEFSNEVVASDPSYSLGTWCQVVLENVKPGKYCCFVKEHDTGDWGKRNSMILVVHEDNIKDELDWSEYEGNIGVDSATFGFFSKANFGGEKFEEDCHKATGRDLLCQRIIPEQTWGLVENGAVCISGLGDGSYMLYTAEKDGQVVAMSVDFGVEEEETIDFDWYKTN